MKKKAYAVVITLIAAYTSVFSLDIFQPELEMYNSESFAAKNIVKYNNSFASTDGNISGGITDALPKPVLDKKIDPDTYILGPGDELVVYIWGVMDKTFRLIINTQGDVSLPQLGVISLAGLSLTAAKELLTTKFKNAYKKVQITIFLGSLRTFKTYIVGEVKMPGVYVVNGATRVSDLVQLAGGITPWGCNRGIKIENEVAGSKYADLAAFFHSNIIEGNPYLNEGDRVYIPKRKKYAVISGFVCYPDSYEIVDGDLVKDIITAAGGLSRGADTSRIMITTFINDFDSISSHIYSLNEAYNIPVEKDFRIHVFGLPQYRIHRQVTIRGEVLYPGVYPIREDKTRLREIIEAAGGLTKDASLANSRIIRKTFPKLSFREFERLQAIPLESLSPSERSFLKLKFIEPEGLMSVNFYELINEDKEVYNIILREDDEIIIARKELSVRVCGAVVFPGLVTYEKGKNYKLYIEQAGGYTSRANPRLTRVIKNRTDGWLTPNEASPIEAGDIIWVPEKLERDGVIVAKDILAVLGSIATIITSLVTIYVYITNIN